MTKVSVIIPCFNQAIYLDEAVDSVLEQTFQDFEIIIVDDGSDDQVSIKILKDFKKPKTKIIRTSNRGPSHARNVGISNAKGEYVLPLDADDKIGPEYLYEAVKILDESPHIGIVYCEAELFGKRSGKWDLPKYKFPSILLNNSIFCTAMFRKSDWLKVGGYKEDMQFGIEDWEFWLSIIEMGLDVYKIPETLFYYRVKETSRTTKSLNHELNMRLKLSDFHNDLYVENLDYIIKSYYDYQTTIKRLNQEIFKKNRQIANLEKVRSSRSWKLTEPLRMIGRLMRKIKKKLKIVYNSIIDNFVSLMRFKLLRKSVNISIIMANFNYADLLSNGINSIISQSYNNWELIIVDDGSSDNSIDVINGFVNSDPKIKLYQHDSGVNKGLNETLQLGLKYAKGDYIAFLEADDWWEENYLKEKINILKKYPRVKFIFNDIEMFSEEYMDLSYFYNYFKWQKGILSKLHMPCNCSKYFAKSNLIPTFSCVFVDRNLILNCNFNSPIDSLLDFWLWTQLSSKTDFYYIDKKLTHWFRHKRSYIQTSTNDQRKKFEKYSDERIKFIKD